jgi:nucleosome binding factor SPN SPT16 subunit
VKHSKLASLAADAALACDAKPVLMKLAQEHVELCYPFVVQSGGDYDTAWTADSNDALLSYSPSGVILVQLGCRYKSYCANVGRTYLIDAPPAVTAAYTALLAAHAAATAAAVEGARCCDVYAAALAALPPDGELRSRLAKALGGVIGLEFRDATLLLSPKCEAALSAGTALNLTTALADVHVAGADLFGGKPFSLLLADTLLVSAGGAPPEVLTAAAKAKVVDVGYTMAEARVSNSVRFRSIVSRSSRSRRRRSRARPRRPSRARRRRPRRRAQTRAAWRSPGARRSRRRWRPRRMRRRSRG